MTYFISALAFFTNLSLVYGVKVDTPSGSLEGYVHRVLDTEDVVASFKGIPYAQPPVGELRFEKPLPVTPWTGKLYAADYGSVCIQALPAVQVSMSEDCLTLNIFVPGNVTLVAAKKAVMIWIHGGSLKTGSGSQYDGTILASTGDVIVVTINYRLGIFGFLNSDGAGPSNVGFWDQHLAIRWVRDNIAAFGGDVSKITIFGESAGSWSVAFQALSPQNNATLFQRAICESGGYMIFGSPQKSILEIAQEADCKILTSEEAVQCLKAMPLSELEKKFIQSNNYRFLPVKDNDFITEDSFQLLSEFVINGTSAVKNKVGNIKSYDMLIGFNSQEGLVGMADGLPPFPLLYENYTGLIRSRLINYLPLSNEAASLLVKMTEVEYSDVVPPSLLNQTQDYQRLSKIIYAWGDLVLAWPTVETAVLHAAMEETNKKTYTYEFDHKRSFSDWIWYEGPEWVRVGSDHADEIPFVFGQVFTNVYGNQYNNREKNLSLAIMKYWTNFAKHGDPDTQSVLERGGVIWPQMEEKERNYLRLTTTADVIESRPLGSRADFWRQAIVASVLTGPKVKPSPAGCTTPVNKSYCNNTSISLMLLLLYLALI